MAAMTPQLEEALEAWLAMKETVGTHRGWSCEDALLRAYRVAKQAKDNERAIIEAAIVAAKVSYPSAVERYQAILQLRKAVMAYEKEQRDEE